MAHSAVLKSAALLVSLVYFSSSANTVPRNSLEPIFPGVTKRWKCHHSNLRICIPVLVSFVSNDCHLWLWSRGQVHGTRALVFSPQQGVGSSPGLDRVCHGGAVKHDALKLWCF